MRSTFVKTISEIARSDKNVWLITGDLGYGMIEPFAKEFPCQFLNVGIAEQNMIGVAAGLALTGKKVFVYSISTFATMRPYEQIRDDVCYQNLPVFVVGGGSAFSYSVFGCSHFPIEDLGIMSIIPNMVVVSPSDPIEVQSLVEAVYHRGGPAYIRLARNGEPKIHKKTSDVVLGKASLIRKGDDATILVSGRLLPSAIEASDILAKKGLSVRILSVHTLKPIDERAVILSAKETGALVTCEEHLISGGLGSAVAFILATRNINAYLTTLGITDEFPKGVGWQDYFLERYNLTPKAIAGAVQKNFNKKNVSKK